jgi:hypothetical protein
MFLAATMENLKLVPVEDCRFKVIFLQESISVAEARRIRTTLSKMSVLCLRISLDKIY